MADGKAQWEVQPDSKKNADEGVTEEGNDWDLLKVDSNELHLLCYIFLSKFLKKKKLPKVLKMHHIFNFYLCTSVKKNLYFLVHFARSYIKIKKIKKHEK